MCGRVFYAKDWKEEQAMLILTLEELVQDIF